MHRYPRSVADLALSMARQFDDKLVKARALRAVALHLPDSVFQEVLSDLAEIYDDTPKFEAARDLAPHLPDELFDIIRLSKTYDYRSKFEAACDVAASLPGELFDVTLDVARQISDPLSERAMALAKLASARSSPSL